MSGRVVAIDLVEEVEIARGRERVISEEKVLGVDSEARILLLVRCNMKSAKR